TYDAFGILLATTDTPSPPRNVYRYCGEQFDPDLSLYYNRARYLNPNAGRFWTMDEFEGDPPQPATLNSYLYCRGDPADQADPSGRFTVAEALVTVAVVATIAAVAIHVINERTGDNVVVRRAKTGAEKLADYALVKLHRFNDDDKDDFNNWF